MRVLVVEDDESTRRLLSSLLRARGHHVTACADGESALETYSREGQPLVVLDWMLPGMDGLELCRRMRALPHGDRSLILMNTSRSSADDLQAVLEAGADDYLAKPVDPAQLNVRVAVAERQVQNLTARKHAEDQVTAVLAALEKSRDDLLSILNRLRVGTAITDHEGRLTFLSAAGERLLGTGRRDVVGQQWDKVFLLTERDRTALAAMSLRPAPERAKVPTRLQTARGHHHWVEFEVHDDPRDAQRKIYILYDMSEVHDLRRLLEEKAQFRDMVGKSEAVRLVYQLIQQVAEVDATVLIEGETGTGKELVARAIHSSSTRRDQPFIAVNCAGLTDSLLASQLFGHRRGAFTDAIADHKGFFEAAQGGTLFLDEIGDIPLNVQTNLLRVLQEKEITRLGDSTPCKVEVRVLAATHHQLNEDVAAGHFRADLLYRIRVARIRLPPLRDRREDIPLLVATFLSQARATTGKSVHEVSNDALRRLVAYHWPGNIRELRSAIEFAVIRCRDSTVEASDLPPEIVETPLVRPVSSSPGGEKQRILVALQDARGNRTEAARLLGISRATLYRRLAELDIAP